MNGVNWKKHGYSSKGLQNLLKDHDIEVNIKHRSTEDAKATLELLSQYNSDGDTYLWELINNSTPRKHSIKEPVYKEVAVTVSSIDITENNTPIIKKEINQTVTNIETKYKKAFLRKIPGFRSNKLWKKIIASIFYLFITICIFR